MKNFKAPRSLLGLHMIFIHLFFTAGCMKTPEMNKDFGPQFTSDQLNQSLSDAQYESTTDSILNIKKGEFAYFEKTNQIETLFPMVIRQRADTVTDLVTPADNSKTVYTITHQLRELDSSTGDMKPSQSQSTACLEKIAGACGTADTIATMSLPDLTKTLQTLKTLTPNLPPNFGAFAGHFNDLSWKSIVKQAQQATSGTSGITWTYHNLVKTYSTAPTPSLVSMRSDCGGRKNPCATPMKTIQVTFDEVDWTSEQYPVKYSYNLVFSAEAPFFAAQLASCGSTTIPYQNQRIAILQCESIKDFTVGHD